MRNRALQLRLVAIIPLLVAAAALLAPAGFGHRLQPGSSALGLFEASSDVGMVLHAGSAVYDSQTKVYTVTGSGENMWFASDNFQYVWKKVAGDVTLTADVTLMGTGGDNHRKAALMIRQSLDPDAPYADAAVHGDGLTSLQFRDEKGSNTHEVQANVSGPRRLRLMKRGDRFYLWVGAAGDPLEFAGGSARVPLTGTYYVGIGVCAHNKDAMQSASFANVDLQNNGRSQKLTSYSTLETVAVSSTDARVSAVSAEPMQGPTWSADGKTLVVSRNGNLERIAVAGGSIQTVNTGLTGLKGHLGFAPDGTKLAVTADKGSAGEAAVYVIPASGGSPSSLESQPPSFFGGWSPDGKMIAYTRVVDGSPQIYTVADGTTTQLTRSPDKTDGPEFSPDGKYIYFASDHGGSVEVWRMLVDGSKPEQVTPSGIENSAFPHVSPDGKQLAFLSYTGEHGYPTNQDVELRVMTLDDRKVKVIAKLVGGQGSFESYAWSPDGKRLAFVSYQSVPAAMAP